MYKLPKYKKKVSNSLEVNSSITNQKALSINLSKYVLWHSFKNFSIIKKTIIRLLYFIIKIIPKKILNTLIK